MRSKAKQIMQAVVLMENGDWKAAHNIVQKDETSALSCWAHGIVHLMEGDVSNARYWYKAAGRPFPEAPSVEDEIKALKSAAGSG